MYQSHFEGWFLPWNLLVKDPPRKKHYDLDFIVDQLDWEANADSNFKDNHYLEPVPVADTRKENFLDQWIVYGRISGFQFFSAKELTVEPGVNCTVKDKGAYGRICVQGKGSINGHSTAGSNSSSTLKESSLLAWVESGEIFLTSQRFKKRRSSAAVQNAGAWLCA